MGGNQITVHCGRQCIALTMSIAWYLSECSFIYCYTVLYKMWYTLWQFCPSTSLSVCFSILFPSVNFVKMAQMFSRTKYYVDITYQMKSSSSEEFKIVIFFSGILLYLWNSTRLTGTLGKAAHAWEPESVSFLTYLASQTSRNCGKLSHNLVWIIGYLCREWSVWCITRCSAGAWSKEISAP